VDRLPYHQIISENDEVNEVMSEIEDMGVEFVEALRCIVDVLTAADHGNYSDNSLTIDIAEHPEYHLKMMCELLRVNERMEFSMFQCFPLKRSLGGVKVRRKSRFVDLHSGIAIIWFTWMENSGIAYIERLWNWISFRSVITDILAMEGFKAEELVHSVVF
jgi:hypothetical protein